MPFSGIWNLELIFTMSGALFWIYMQNKARREAGFVILNIS